MIRSMTSAAMAVFALAAAPLAVQAGPAFSLAADGTTLIRFDTALPGAVTTIGSITGATTKLDGLDFRPANGLLYGYQSSSSGIFVVDTNTGATTFVSTSTAPVSAATMGIDFNPVPDRLRLVNTADDNKRINVTTGTAINDGPLAFAAGDRNASANPNVADAAYTNVDNNAATGTALYYIDFVLDALLTTTAPNAGFLTTVGALGFDTSEFVGFDITTLNGVNSAFATLTVGGIAGLYSINLGTGAASFIDAIPGFELNGLAIAIPEPGTLSLSLAAGLAVVVGNRRRRVSATAV